MKRFLLRASLTVPGASLLAGCIDSAQPILTDAQPLFGPRPNLQLYAVSDGHARDPERANFAWNGKHYARLRGMKDVSGFSVHPFEGGTYIIQSFPVRQPRHVEYALMRKLAEGTYLVKAIDEDDADEPTRKAHCKHEGGAACRIETREQLFAFARATAARPKDEGGLAILLQDGTPPERPANRQ